MQERRKTSIAMTEATYEKLDALKRRLRKAGVPRGEANVSAILEALVATADFDVLLEKLSG